MKLNGQDSWPKGTPDRNSKYKEKLENSNSKSQIPNPKSKALLFTAGTKTWESVRWPDSFSQPGQNNEQKFN